VHQEITTDVVIVGGGGAGLAAAIEAATLGCKVILLEKAAKLGGTTAWAVGSITANQTPHQRRKGIVDTPDAHAEDMSIFAGDLATRDNLALQRLYVDNVSETFDWLMAMGLVFLGPMPEPPHRVPRMHNIVPNSGAFPYILGRRCKKIGVDIRLSTGADSVIMENGRAVGVIAKDATGAIWSFRATRGVVLSTGDFSGGAALKRSYISDDAALTPAVAEASFGDGHQMVLDVGGRILNGDLVWGPLMRFVPPPNKGLIQRLPPNKWIGIAAKMAYELLPQFLLRPFLMGFVTTVLGPEPSLYQHGAILVNKLGQRFANELENPSAALVHQPSQIAYVVMSSETAVKFQKWPYFISTAPGVAYAYLSDYRRSRRDIHFEDASLVGLARKIGVNPKELEKSLPVGTGPYVALGPIRPYVLITDGGLKVTNQLQVTGADDLPIPGLYAAGSSGQGGVLLYGHGHHLGWAFVSGRIAGKNVSKSE